MNVVKIIWEALPTCMNRVDNGGKTILWIALKVGYVWMGLKIFISSEGDSSQCDLLGCSAIWIWWDPSNSTSMANLRIHSSDTHKQ